MANALTDRATFAGVLAQLVRNRCASGANRTSRTGLQATIPVSERPAVRRGVEALIEAGVLAIHGEDIGLTPDGSQFLAHVQRAQGRKSDLERHQEDAVALQRVLEAVEHDERFEPYSMEDVRTLPARLENYRSHRTRAGFSMSRWAIAMVVLVLAIIAIYLARR